ncbi:uncharacterized protein B0J16DRAFT_52572 [Fusarium flagelliforme]|uniref:Uncharacterized protein n=1 Tax=Fusarium flagelliforme TaxID=2675880 RepID=A0A395MUT4_9HYPO|nr:uncharacterized protein B0J16DRAFT_52572 [Fusarium flagelliforme]KAH7192006.1 hypothetical protein B0J16DRAFT_52572 [Fusarium flagelliforme]RFN51487.1 hypothetical protein FIE12Z_4223 [Fusarium flagelliforme]
MTAVMDYNPPPAFGSNGQDTSHVQMSNIKNSIREAFPKTSELLNLLEQTKHIRDDVALQQKVVSDLESQLADSNRELEGLDRKRLADFESHKKYRDGHAMKFLYKIGGKENSFTGQAEREEQNYHNTLQQAHHAAEHNSSVKAKLEDELAKKRELDQSMQYYLDLQKQLDDIYDDIFSGPTPDFPEEDEKERQSDAALSTYVSTKSAFELHQKALELLEQATATMSAGLQQVEKALQSGDMNSIRSLNQGRELIQQSKTTVDQLVQLGSDVIRLPPEANPRTMEVTSNLGEVWGKVDVTGGRQEVARCTAALENCLSEAKEKRYYLSKELKRKGEEMERARTGLQKIRQSIFEEVVGDDLIKS